MREMRNSFHVMRSTNFVGNWFVSYSSSSLCS